MASILKEFDSQALIINSVPDHAYALFRMSKTVTIAEVMEQMKKSSSKWVKKRALGRGKRMNGRTEKRRNRRSFLS